MDSNQIKHVAVYLRKSRDEGEYEDVLSKHRDTLLAYVERKNWTYQLYEEIASGEKIKSRKVMQKLLRDVSKKLYDGVLVMDIDRLGRGENADWALIKDTFLDSETLIVTPNSTYDLEDDMQDVQFDFLATFAKLEYRTIKRRMQQGKAAGAKKGMWTNGKPPFPYYYDKITRSVLVDETKRPIYRLIVEKYLAGENLGAIAVWLTNNNIPTPYNIKPNGRDKGWSNVTVQRLLVSEIHLGYIVYGKTKTKRHGQIEIVPDNERIKVQGSHEVLKTREEHDAILARLAKNKLINPNGRRNTLPLSGLLYCAKCNSKMQFKVGYSKSRGQYWSVMCVHTFKDGTKCEQTGKILDEDFFNALFSRIINVDPKALKNMEDANRRVSDTQSVIDVKEQELLKHRRALEKLQESFEEDIITKQTFVERRNVRTKQIQVLEEELGQLRKLKNDSAGPTMDQILKRVEFFKQQWVEMQTPEEKNKALKKLIDRIVYNREDNRIYLNVSYR